MSDRELEAIKQRKLQELQKKLSLQEQKKNPMEPKAILSRILDEKAWEVFNAARAQFPSEMAEVESLLLKLALDGKITHVDGEELYAFLKEVGLPIRLNTTINVTRHGETKSPSAKLRDSAT
jgi:DNA-binding TFAR19-related protein (PDSD5 family)